MVASKLLIYGARTPLRRDRKMSGRASRNEDYIILEQQVFSSKFSLEAYGTVGTLDSWGMPINMMSESCRLAHLRFVISGARR